jgi:hypothetical protein
MSKPHDEPADDFASIDPAQLETVAGGAKGADAQVLAMLTSIGDSIKSLASSNQSSGSDPMQMMMMMMMMGGMGGGGGSAAPAAAPTPPPAPVINVSVKRG